MTIMVGSARDVYNTFRLYTHAFDERARLSLLLLSV